MSNEAGLVLVHGAENLLNVEHSRFVQLSCQVNQHQLDHLGLLGEGHQSL